MELTQVTMSLTPTDIKNATTVFERTQAKNKAQAVSTALAIAATLIGEAGSEIFVRRKDGATYKLLIPATTS